MLVHEKIKARLNWGLVGVTAALCLIGVANLYSAASRTGDTGIPSLVWQQVIWLGLGWLVLLVVMFIDYRFWGRFSYVLYLIYLLLMIAVLIVGREVAGHKSWLDLGAFRIQPSEIGKIVLPMVLARCFAQHPAGGGYYLRELIIPLGLAGIPALLVLMQGDFGGAVFYVIIFLSMLLFAGIRRGVVIAMLVALLVGGTLTYSFVLTQPQRSRIISFVHPGSDLKGRGYQIAQAKIAIGSGWIAGKGYLHGIRHKLYYVPARHTDFVFSVFAEEWGFIGSVIVLVLYLSLIMFGIETASGAKDRFGLFLGLGMTTALFWQVTINLFGVLGMLPLTGVTLPFMSYGGSSVVMMLVAVGLLLSIRMRRFMF